jgi:tetratricopeptide (TPR) repeat protein
VETAVKRGAAILFVILAMGCAFSGQENDEQGPSNPKAQKTYKEALELIHQRMKPAALDAFKKADKQDDGKCVACQRRMLRYGVDLQDWKAAEQGAEELIAEAEPGKQLALAHYELGVVLLDEGIPKRKDEIFEHAHQEFGKALEAAAKFPSALYCDGRALALLKQDDAAKARFQQFVALDPAGSPDRQRALRYIAQPDLVRARLAPPFAVTTLDGQRISLDDLQGKVVLLDFWATWCAPCRAALPHVQQIVKKFQGRPFVVLSVSVDSDQNKWRDFVTKNEMT